MKTNRLFFSRYFIVIVLIIGVIGTLPTPIAEGATTNTSAISDKASSSTTEAANKALTATKQANQNSISNVVTQFASPLDSVNSTSSITTLNNLISPLTINSSTIEGPAGNTGLYLESNVNYVFNSDNNPSNLGNTGTITLKYNKPGTVPKVIHWTLVDRSGNGNVTVDASNKNKKTSAGDTIQITDDQTVVVGGSGIKTGNPNMIDGGFISVKTDPENDAPVYIDIPTGGAMTSEDFSDHAFDDTLMHFHIKNDIFSRVIDDFISRKGLTSYKDFEWTSIKLEWVVDNREKMENPGTPPIGYKSYDLTFNNNTHEISFDPSILNYSFVFFKDGLNTSYNVVHATLTGSFRYKKTSLIDTGKGSRSVNFGGIFAVSPLNEAPTTDEELPKLSISNQIQNLTNPDSNVTDGDKKGLEIRNVKNGDKIEYGANFDAESASGSGGNPALIRQGVYTVPIPKGVDIDTNGIKYTSFYDYQNSVDNSKYNLVDSDNVSIQDDPNDSSKQLLTVKGLSITPQVSGDIGRLVFYGKVTDDNQSDFTFTPSFKGVGGYDNNDQTKPLYVEADGQDQLINFDPTKPSGGVTLTPINIDFGSLNSIINSDLLKHRVNDSSSPVLSIQDDRSDANKNSQTVSVQQKGELTNGGSAFPGELRFYDPSGSNDEFKSLVSGEIVPIYISKNGETIPSISWENNKGLLLHVNGSNTAIPSGKYTTTLDWTVSDTI